MRNRELELILSPLGDTVVIWYTCESTCCKCPVVFIVHDTLFYEFNLCFSAFESITLYGHDGSSIGKEQNQTWRLIVKVTFLNVDLHLLYLPSGQMSWKINVEDPKCKLSLWYLINLCDLICFAPDGVIMHIITLHLLVKICIIYNG